MQAWWTDQTAAYIGAFGGSGVGILGAILGTLSGVVVPKGKCKSLVYSLFGIVVALGIATLITGIVAVVLGQPYAVWYPLVLLGFIPTVVLASIFPAVRMRYAQADQRKLDAQEILRG